MIKCKVEKGGYVRVKAEGTAHNLAVETSAMIEMIYKKTVKKNPEAAREYRNKLLIMLLGPNSPVWEDELE